MKISQKGLDLIKHFEGFRSCPYRDVVGVPTIGYGTTHYHERAVSMHDQCISKETAEILLRDQIDSHYSKYVNHYVHIKLDQNQFDALVSFAYNLGVGSLKMSTLLKKLNHGDFDGAAKEFKKWDHAGGHVVKGLLVRREAEADMFLA